MAKVEKTMKDLFFNDKVILLVIIINTFVIFANGSSNGLGSLHYIDGLFTLFFLVEASVKIKTIGWKNYWKEGWNKFDFIIVLLALPSILNILLDIKLSTNVVLAFKTFRVFKSFLLFRHIPNISSILKGIKQAAKSSILVCAAYVVFLVVFSILTSELFGHYAPQYFETPVFSLYSIFRLFTIEGWYEMPEAIAATGGTAMGTIARIYFSVLLFAGGIIGMSFVNSIFVDAMVSDNNNEVLEKLEKIEKEIQELKNR